MARRPSEADALQLSGYPSFTGSAVAIAEPVTRAAPTIMGTVSLASQPGEGILRFLLRGDDDAEVCASNGAQI